MPRPLIRFVLEAGFLVLVAIAAGVARFDPPAIVVVMGAAWILVALVERAASREASRRAARAGEEAGEEAAGPAEPAPAAALEPEPEPPAVPRVRWRPWRRRLKPAPSRPALEQPRGPTPQHVRVIPHEEAPPAESAPEPVALEPAARTAEPSFSPGEPPPAEVERAHAPAPLVKAAEEVPEPAPAEPAAPALEVVPEAAEPAPEPPEAPPEEVVPVVRLPERPREWNLWELEQLARRRAGEDPARDEDWSFLFMYLREFATPDGSLPVDFDSLVRESFGDLLAAAPR